MGRAEGSQRLEREYSTTRPPPPPHTTFHAIPLAPTLMLRNLTRRATGAGASPSKPPSTAGYDALFESHKEADEETIAPEGIERLCEAMGVDPSNVLLLVLAWTLDATTMGYISREEWNKGRATLGGAASAPVLTTALEGRLRAVHADPTQLRSLWLFAHAFCREGSRKNVDLCSACAMIGMVLRPLFEAHVDSLLLFLEHHEPVQKRGLSKDEWAMVFAHPPISPICRTPFFPYLTFYSSFLRPPRSSRADAPPSPSKRPRSPPRSSRRDSSSLARRHHP